MAVRRFPNENYGSVWVLMALMIVLSVATWAPGTRDRAVEVLKLSPEGVRSGEVWRLITYAFPTSAGFGFLFALLILYYIAAPLEAVWGTRRFVTLYLVTSVGAGLTATVFGQELLGGWAPMMSLMLIHGFLFPESMIYLFFILPMRIKTLAIIMAAIYFAQCATMGLTGLAMFLGTFTGVLYYVAVTRSIPWVRRAKRRVAETAADPLGSLRGMTTARVMERARRIMKEHKAGKPLTDPDRQFIEELVQRADPTHELCSPYSFSPENTICPPCKAFGRCLRRYLEQTEGK